ncbi:MAG: alanine--tRNA ligase [Deltaproteobacteria bacterium]|nr:alanine--tRNA ligase [Deltaproteobacteria bacterium]
MKGSEIRSLFLDYFEKKGHKILSSSSLIPRDDPTLLFTNAGMVQFKDIFTGEKKRTVPTAATSQKCMRAGGKHNDLENVGRTARHQTFFEMLGNFSFGDYFKEEAIPLAWKFLTGELSLPTERLWVSVYHEDEEAFRIWKEKMHVPEERILRLGEKDNFWAMGDIGPCGPCSEIHIDQGEGIGCGRSGCNVECDCDRFLEIWNLVFMQYSRDAAGQLTPLPKPSIDTGMGLERITAVVQGVTSNYDTDLFSGIIEAICSIAGVRYGTGQDSDTSIRVIADHIRALTFLIADGVLPSNEGRGYVLRRVLRRAARHGKLLNVEGPFLYRLSATVVDEMRGGYPELVPAREHVAAVILNEEERFLHTLDQGLALLNEEIDKLARSGETILAGEEVFKLYDTYGFPLDLTRDILGEKGLSLDETGFHKAMNRQRERARSSWKGGGEKGVDPLFKGLSEKFSTSFVGYERIEAVATVVALIQEGKVVEAVSKGEEALAVLDVTPFYAESGGQVGDQGRIEWEGGSAVVHETRRPAGEMIVHAVRVEEGKLQTRQAVTAKVDSEVRRKTADNHTATHILQAVLRRVLGDHVKQAGSLVAPDRLRFDFTHFTQVGPRELERIEQLANEWIRRDAPVQKEVKPLNEALDEGVTALFGEKYGDEVRVISIPGLSKELCGGTHIDRTGEIGLFKIVHEGGIAAGVRRIEAVTADSAYRSFKSSESELLSLAEMVRGAPGEIVSKVEKILRDRKALTAEVAALKRELAAAKGGDLDEDVQEVEGIRILSRRMDRLSIEELRDFADQARDKIGSGVIVAGSANDGKVALVAMVSRDLTGKVHAGNLIREVAKVTGGGGGGRPDMAQAGGKDPSRLDEALSMVADLVRQQVGPAGSG